MELSEKGTLEYPLSNPHQPFPYGLRDQLCHRCSAIDFRRLFSKGSHVDVSKDPVVGICLNGFDTPDFGSRDGLTRSRRCPFCRLVLDLVRRRSIIQPPWSQEEHWSLEAVTTDDTLFNFQRQSESRWMHGNKYEYTAEGLNISRTSALCFAIRSGSFWTCDFLEDIAARRFPGYISLCDNVNCVERTLFRSRQVPSNQADLETLKKWLSYCARHERCSKRSLSPPKGLRVIDAKRRQLIDAPEHCEYIALSYVWGGCPMPELGQSTNACYCSDACRPESRKEKIFNKQQVKSSCKWLELYQKYPQTIEDSIAVALALGYNYLWVDSICLSQKDLDNPSTLTEAMNSIYECAYLTIIAAAGKDAEAGLPGVRPNSRDVIQHLESVDGMRLGVAMPTLAQQIAESTWSSRAWTYQEGIMCQRYLIFTAQQVYWECRQAAFCEAIEEPVEAFADMNELPSFALVLGSSFMERAQFGETYCKLVGGYSARQLTYESDGLRAVSGLLRRLEISFGVEFICGIPKDSMPEFLLWNHQLQMDAPKMVQRRVSIPSWSWAGWSGTVEFSILTERVWKPCMIGNPVPSEDDHLQFLYARMYESNMVAGNPSNIASKTLSNGNLACEVVREWNPIFFTDGFSWSQDSTDKQILRCEARTAVFKLFKAKSSMEIECTFTLSYLDKPPPGGHEKVAARVKVHMDCNSGEFEGYDQQLVEVMECGQYCKWTPLVRTSCFILLSWEGGVASRIGVGCVCSRAFENASPTNKVVRLR